MGLEQKIREDLRGVPPTLIPEPGLADGVLASVRRRRRTARAVVAILAVLGGVAMVAPQATLRGGSTGGRVPVIHLYTTAEGAFLLDEKTGDFKRLPFTEATLSPDLRTVAVSGEDGRVGLAPRSGLLRDGTSAVTWTDVRGTAPRWSPDGTAILVTDVIKDNGPLMFMARRLDVASRKVSETVLPSDILGQAGWAADSRRYLVLLKQGESGDGGVLPGAMQYVDPDGALGPRIEVAGGEMAGYSPEGSLLLLDCSRLMTSKPLPSKLIDVSTGTVVREFTGRPIGWADRIHYVLLSGQRLELVDAATGEVDEVIPLDRRTAGLTGASLAGAS